MEPAIPYNPRAVEDVFKDFKGRRAGLLKALTSDVEDFYQQCDPGKDILCLYGFPSEHWEVNLPPEESPPDVPEPTLGINFARDGMQKKDWLSLVAVHSDSWLLSVAFYFGARFSLNSNDRMRLFGMINELPTIYEILTGTAKKQVKEKSSTTNHSSNVSKANSEGVKHSKATVPLQKEEEEKVFGEEDEEEEDSDTLCGACGASSASGEFWICCDVCEEWFHGKCVKMTAARAKRIKLYKCPSCCNKKSRHW